MKRLTTVCALALAASLLVMVGIYGFLQLGVTVDATWKSLDSVGPKWPAIIWNVALGVAVLSAFALAVSSVAGAFVGKTGSPDDEE